VLGSGGYRTREEIEAWRQRDPIARFRAALTAAGTAGAADLDTIDAEVASRVADAVAYAEAGEPADPELAETLMFAPESPDSPESPEES
jgi:pyruvate dehydrogenase E1 component alpha subunit